MVAKKNTDKQTVIKLSFEPLYLTQDLFLQLLKMRYAEPVNGIIPSVQIGRVWQAKLRFIGWSGNCLEKVADELPYRRYLHRQFHQIHRLSTEISQDHGFRLVVSPGYAVHMLDRTKASNSAHTAA